MSKAILYQNLKKLPRSNSQVAIDKLLYMTTTVLCKSLKTKSYTGRDTFNYRSKSDNNFPLESRPDAPATTVSSQGTFQPPGAVQALEMRHHVRREEITRPVLPDLGPQVIAGNAHVFVLEPRDDRLDARRDFLDEGVNV